MARVNHALRPEVHCASHDERRRLLRERGAEVDAVEVLEDLDALVERDGGRDQQLRVEHALRAELGARLVSQLGRLLAELAEVAILERLDPERRDEIRRVRWGPREASHHRSAQRFEIALPEAAHHPRGRVPHGHRQIARLLVARLPRQAEHARMDLRHRPVALRVRDGHVEIPERDRHRHEHLGVVLRRAGVQGRRQVERRVEVDEPHDLVAALRGDERLHRQRHPDDLEQIVDALRRALPAGDREQGPGLLHRREIDPRRRLHGDGRGRGRGRLLRRRRSGARGDEAGERDQRAP